MADLIIHQVQDSSIRFLDNPAFAELHLKFHSHDHGEVIVVLDSETLPEKFCNWEPRMQHRFQVMYGWMFGFTCLAALCISQVF